MVDKVYAKEHANDKESSYNQHRVNFDADV